MKDLIIVGAGGFGREAFALARYLNKKNPQWNIRGFINDIPDALDGVKIDAKIIGTIKDWQPSDNEVFVMGIASPAGKEKVATMLKARGAKFLTMISPAAIIGDYVEIGEGCVINGPASVGGCAKIGNFVHIAASMVGQDAVIGDYSTTTGFANVTNAIIGKKVFVGSHACIMNKLKIGDEAIVGMGSVVISNVKPGTRVFGNPAKKVDL